MTETSVIDKGYDNVELSEQYVTFRPTYSAEVFETILAYL